MDRKGQGSVAIAIIVLLVLLISVIVLVVWLQEGNQLATPPTTPTVPTIPSQPSPTNETWCVAGSPFDFSPYGMQGGGTVQGMVVFEGRNLCKASATVNMQNYLVYMNQNGTVWYITDESGTVLGSWEDPFITSYSG